MSMVDAYSKLDTAINKATYDMCVRAFSLLEKRLGLNIIFHHDKGQVETGQIFLFNHFARFETIIPQYLIYKESGVYCRCVAAKELFQGNTAFAQFLFSVGAVPNDMPGLLPFLAAEILRGHKVIVFPEGGMVKDRQVLDERGEYNIFSSSSDTRRKHHRGAAVIALTLDAFKKRILMVNENGETNRLLRWVNALGLNNIDELLAAANKPTLIVPANITFYPIRISENILSKGAELIAKGIAPKFAEELLIEGNILLKDTDMDVRLGDPIAPGEKWRWWERLLLQRFFSQIDSLEDLFGLDNESGKWIEKLVSTFFGRAASRTRDLYMHTIYTGVTLNLSHLAARLIQELCNTGRSRISRDLFHRALYLAVKYVQNETDVHLRVGLRVPKNYLTVLEGHGEGLRQFIETAEEAELIKIENNDYVFLPKLRQDHGFHEVRLENIISVYANEMAPIAGARKAVQAALKAFETVEQKVFAQFLFDDELRQFQHSRQQFQGPAFADINRQETANADAAPYLLTSDVTENLGVLVVHGFLASPAELRSLGEMLHGAGYPVMGVRLAGHGTTPWDLREQGWEDWSNSVKRGYEILSAYADNICIVGFSTGGTLALLQGARKPDKLAGIVAVSSPVHFRNKNLIFTPIVHGANKITRWVSKYEGIVPFIKNNTEHPNINYRNIPVRGLHELRNVVAQLKKHLSDVSCPVLLVQGTNDPVVSPDSVDFIYDHLATKRKSIHLVESEKHGIVYDQIGDTHDAILTFVESLSHFDEKFEGNVIPIDRGSLSKAS